MAMTLSELWRRVQNVITTAKVEKTMAADGKMLVMVKYTDTGTGEEHLSDWLPVATKNNSFIKIWMPVLVGEQVTVFRPFGEGDGGIVFTSIHHKGNKEIVGANEHNAIVQFSDGCTIIYDTQSKELSVFGLDSVSITAPSVTVTCEDMVITGDLEVGGEITDSRGDLTNHSHLGRAGTTPLPRD